MLHRQEELKAAMDRLLLYSQEEVERDSEAENNLSIHEGDLVEQLNEPEIPVIVDEAQLSERIRVLNREQQEGFKLVRQHITSNSQEPLFLCLHGSGGTGKSFVARIIIDLINVQYNDGLPSFSKNVIVAAPTGVAAKNINGVTCHSAFSLPIEKFNICE